MKEGSTRVVDYLLGVTWWLTNDVSFIMKKIPQAMVIK